MSENSVPAAAGTLFVARHDPGTSPAQARHKPVKIDNFSVKIDKISVKIFSCLRSPGRPGLAQAWPGPAQARHRGTEVAFDEGLGKLRQHSAAISEHGAGILVIGSAACAEH